MRRPALALVLLLALSALPAPAPAAPTAAQRAALRQLFAAGVERGGARAELVAVERWPETRAPLVWRVPRGRGWPARIVLTAEAPDGGRWQVPVRVRWFARAVVAARALPAQVRLGAADLGLARAEVTNLHAWAREPDALAGARLLRPVAAGQALDLRWIVRPPAVRRGEVVRVVAELGALRVQTLGKALATARTGEAVPVENLASRRRIEAVAAARGVVRVPLGGVR